MLKKYLIAYFFVLVNFVFVVTFVIKNNKKKREKLGKHLKLVTLVRTVPILELLPCPPPRIFLMANGP